MLFRSRAVEATPRGTSWLGLFYAGNIAGAVFGTLLAGFYLLRVFDMQVATFVAAAINAAVAAVAWRLASGAPGPAETPGTAVPRPDADARTVRAVYVAVALSGFCALAAEVVWTRMLALAFGATVYTFSIILAVFLLGLWAGSIAGAFVSRRASDAVGALAACQIFLVLSIGGHPSGGAGTVHADP